MEKKAKFEVFLDVKQQFRFRLVAPNGEIISVSEAYTTRGGAMAGIAAVQRYAGAAEVSNAPA